MKASLAHLVTAAVLDVATLVMLRPDISSLRQTASAPVRTMTNEGVDRMVAEFAGAALWCAAAWVGIGLLTVAVALLPGLPGALSLRIARLLLPAVLWRLVVGTAGLGVFLAPIAAVAAPASGSTSTPVHRAVPSPVWPSSPTTSPAVSAPYWPSEQPAHPSSRSTAAGHTPATDGADDGIPRTVQVRRGDSLWLLAGRRLGAAADAHQIADYWPQLYAANQQLVGDDPSLIRPGQVLHEPTPNAKETS